MSRPRECKHEKRRNGACTSCGAAALFSIDGLESQAWHAATDQSDWVEVDASELLAMIDAHRLTASDVEALRWLKARSLDLLGGDRYDQSEYEAHCQVARGIEVISRLIQGTTTLDKTRRGS